MSHWDTNEVGQSHRMPGMPPSKQPIQRGLIWTLRRAEPGQYIPCGCCMKPVRGLPVYGWIAYGTPFVLCCPCATQHYGAPLIGQPNSINVVSRGYTHRCIECSLVRCAGEGHRCEECAANMARLTG